MSAYPDAGHALDETAADRHLVGLAAPERRRVVIRLLGGDELEVGSADGRDEALGIARQAVSEIEAATGQGAWPEVGDRLLRPGAIVSVDVQRG